MRKTVEMDFEYNNTIEAPPQSHDIMYKQACSNDSITVETWRKTWVDQAKANHAKYGPFKDKSIGKLWNTLARQPAIVAGSGPSLANNVEQLKDTKGIPILSCLHNFQYFEDNGVKVQYYVSLDAGEVTVSEISEGGKKTHEEYLEATKDKTLLAYVGSHPKLLDSWRGEILFFSCPIPDQEVLKQMKEIENFHCWVSTGGNVLGACAYIAKAIMGANPLVFVGADFCFSYIKKFHAWNSKYDEKLGHCIRAIDVYGNRVLTWQSYYNFKTFFDWLACHVRGIYINCSEGGLLGAYPEGNIRQIIQMPLEQLIRMYNLHEEMKEQSADPSKEDYKILY